MVKRCECGFKVRVKGYCINCRNKYRMRSITDNIKAKKFKEKQPSLNVYIVNDEDLEIDFIALEDKKDE